MALKLARKASLQSAIIHSMILLIFQRFVGVVDVDFSVLLSNGHFRVADHLRYFFTDVQFFILRKPVDNDARSLLVVSVDSIPQKLPDDSLP